MTPIHRHLVLCSLLALAACGDDSGTSGSGGASASNGASTSAAATTSPASNGAGGDTGPSSSSTGAGSGGDPGEGGATGAGGDATGGGPECSTALSDEFDDPCTVANWTDGPSTAFDFYDIDETTPEQLTVEPQQCVWYMENQGWALFKEVTGDFAIVARVEAAGLATPGDPPAEQFNSAGVIARDPASAPGSENWLVHNVGFQETSVATEAKTTVDSVSVYRLTDGAPSGEVAICRLGSMFHLFRRLDGEAEWTETTSEDDPAYPPYDRADLPDTLEVGIMANAFAPTPDILARFEYVHFTRPTSLEECVADLPLE